MDSVTGLSSIWQIVLAVVASFGGISGIIVLIIGYASKIIASRLEARYQLKLNEELESYKSEISKTIEIHKTELGTKQYISAKRFDAEFEIYQRLTKAFFESVRDCAIMIPTYAMVPEDEDERKKADELHYKNAVKSYVQAQDLLCSVIPFIPDDFYSSYQELLRLLRLQLDAYEKRFDVGYLAPQSEKERFDRADYHRTRDINELFNNICVKVREYLNSLDVIG